DSPHLFGLGLKEMLADEITQDLRAIQTAAIAQAHSSGRSVTLALDSKGIHYGKITASPSGGVDTSQVQGIDPDLRVRQIFFDGELFSIREAIIATFKFELGMQPTDPVMTAVKAGTKQTTPSGLVLDASTDQFFGPAPCAENTVCDGSNMVNEFPASLVDLEEFYLLNYFSPGTYESENHVIDNGVQAFNHMGCGACHIQNLQINHDRRVADVRTAYDPAHGGFNSMYATVTPLFQTMPGGVKVPNGQPYLVKNIFTDFKRHDLGPNYHENLFDGGTTTMFLTTPLWGIGSTAPYGHDGRSINLNEAILRHGGEAQTARDAYARAGQGDRQRVLDMLNALVLFPPDDTASSLKGESPSTTGYPQNGHGAIALGALFNNPKDPE
ncbi:MAG: thiol oxidoreductase-like protein, partial [Acidobacteriota bacterium]|nr:thiol oxidoreductase-like protein [Acidobacteriota bacterium]